MSWVAAVEQEADMVARDEKLVWDRIKEMLEERLAGHLSAIIWPEKSGEVPNRQPIFQKALPESNLLPARKSDGVVIFEQIFPYAASVCMEPMIDFQPFFALLGADEAAGEETS